MSSALLRILTISFCFFWMVALCAAQSAVDPADVAKHGGGMIEQAPAPQPLDYGKLTQEAATLLSKYIQIDTTNPPGNELPAAKLLREKFLEDGIPASVWEPQPGRGVVAARLHGGGHHTKALVLLSHLDVMGANPNGWQVPPFSGQIKDGAIWGRGALDDKGPGVIQLMAMLAVKRSGILLDRDIVFLATGDEVQGGKNGAGWVVTHESNLFSDAGYLLNQGGSIRQAGNGRRFYAVSITEKTPFWLKVTAQGQPARTIAPPEDTSVTRLIRALDRLLAYQPPIHIIDPVRDYFQAVGQLEGGPAEYADLAKALHDDPEFAKKFLANPRNNAFVRNTITPTRLTGSDATNLIPNSAQAELDVRLLPAGNPQEVERNITKVLDDKNLKVETLLNFPSASSPRNSQLMNAITKLAQTEDARVVPCMGLSFTDSHYFRQKGLISYGFVPIELTSAEEQRINGVNERISVKELGAGIYRMVQLLNYIGTH
ncbi:MAG TPA: M20/M25/M40 family metallo-hydrolase [Candidatus Binataceae bacterium]|nr:M20/M25/M40 family metallo-hydrolase [Candidatus Binataceae bacterium]